MSKIPNEPNEESRPEWGGSVCRQSEDLQGQGGCELEPVEGGTNQNQFAGV
jgi:hypothetical protein